MKALYLLVSIVAIYIGSYLVLLKRTPEVHGCHLGICEKTQQARFFGRYPMADFLFLPLHVLDRRVRRDYWASSHEPEISLAEEGLIQLYNRNFDSATIESSPGAP